MAFVNTEKKKKNNKAKQTSKQIKQKHVQFSHIFKVYFLVDTISVLNLGSR